jgi:hypothetical protein
MSTLSLAAHTVVFTGATLEELHDQICKYVVKVGLADEVKPTPPAPTPAPASMATPIPAEPSLTPPPAWAGGPIGEQEFVGSDGHLLWCKPDEFVRWCNTLTEVFNVTSNLRWVKDTYNLIVEALVTMPPKLATKAKELASQRSYGAPEYLVAEYHYNRWMIAREEYVIRLLHRMKSLVPKNDGLHCQIEEMVDPDLRKGNFFKKRLFQLAIKLIKEHGWKGPTNWNLAGTEFQKVAIDASKVKIDGCNYALTTGGSLDTIKLAYALKTQ